MYILCGTNQTQHCLLHMALIHLSVIQGLSFSTQTQKWLVWSSMKTFKVIIVSAFISSPLLKSNCVVKSWTVLLILVKHKIIPLMVFEHWVPIHRFNHTKLVCCAVPSPLPKLLSTLTPHASRKRWRNVWLSWRKPALTGVMACHVVHKGLLGMFLPLLSLRSENY